MRKLDPSELYDLDPDRPDLDGAVLVQALDGFIDAGGARKLASDHLLETLQGKVVARFDHDQLFDYRARRPVMIFAKDHWQSYDTPQLALHLLYDEAGTPFLVLAGPEPDVQWERFVAAVEQLCKTLGVRRSIGLNAIPMGLPHTRPVGVIAHGVPQALVEAYEPWIETVQVPGSAGHLLELRLGEAGYESMGFAVHVPHYVAQTTYPAAAAQLVREVAKAGGLQLPVDALDEAAVVTRAALDEQVAGAPEVAEVVRQLEEQYDAFVSGRGRSLLVDGQDQIVEADLPTADELGAELERFLAQQPPSD
jgi:predicted ATP-grasp superfamily ATP-dependent carboligase